MKWKAAAAQELINKKEVGERKLILVIYQYMGKSLSKISESLNAKIYINNKHLFYIYLTSKTFFFRKKEQI